MSTWIMNTLSKELSGSVIYAEMDKELWCDLCDFLQINGLCIPQIEWGISYITQVNDFVLYKTKGIMEWVDLLVV